MQKWEYKRLHGDLSEKAMNELGENGWELILFDFRGDVFIFKRPK